MITYEYDPEYHKFVRLPVTEFLQRETGFPCLRTYHHQEHGAWVVSLFDHRTSTLLDIGLLGVGEEPDVSKVRVDFIIHRLRNLVDRAEAKRRVRAQDRAQRRQINDMALRQEDVAMKQYHRIKRRRGENAADSYARAAGFPELVGGGKPKWHSQELGI